MLVLIVEDDPAVRESLERCLSFEGYDVVSAGDGEAGLAAVGLHRPDAVLLDLQLPLMDGLEVCRRIRASGDGVPVLILTARDATPERVSGLDAGADDYLPKPFALEELLARLRALLRRSRVTSMTDATSMARLAQAKAEKAERAEQAEEALVVADLRLVVPSRELTRDGHPIELTRTEYELLELLMLHPRQVLTRTQILREVWGYDYDPGSNTLEVYIGYLRRKTEEHGGRRLIHTIRGVGYVLRAPAQDRAGG